MEYLNIRTPFSTTLGMKQNGDTVVIVTAPDSCRHRYCLSHDHDDVNCIMFSFSTVLSSLYVFILMIQWLASSHIKYVKINNTKHSKINIKINISLFEHRVPPYLHGSKPHVSSQIGQFGGVIRHIQRHQSSDCWQVISHNHYIYILHYITFNHTPLCRFISCLPRMLVKSTAHVWICLDHRHQQLRNASRSSWASSWTGAPLKMQSQYVSVNIVHNLFYIPISPISLYFSSDALYYIFFR